MTDPNEKRRLANEYAKTKGDDCLCQRTQPGTSFGECIYCFCGCDIADAFDAGFTRAVEMLRSKDAEKKCLDNTLGSGNFVSHSEWADWLESQLTKV